MREHIYTVINKIDDRFFRGILKKVFHLYRQKRESRRLKMQLKNPEAWYDKNSLIGRRFHKGKKVKVIREYNCAVSDLVMAQYIDNNFNDYMFCGLAVRQMAIQQKHDSQGNGIVLYQKMQEHTGFDWWPRFSKLIDSYEKDGFDDDKPIEINRDHLIMDGAHRLSLAVYYKKEFLPVKMMDCPWNLTTNIDYFLSKDYKIEDCKLITEKTNDLLKSYVYDYVGVIWPPAKAYFDDILKDLNYIIGDRGNIIKVQDVELSVLDFDGFLRAMYHEDILDSHGMNSKIRKIMERSGDVDKYAARIIYMRFDNPKIATNYKNMSTQSLEVKRLKSVIRPRYSDKVMDYVYDVIMHISDNYIQSKFCRIVVEMDKNISALYEMLSKYNYAIIKGEDRLSNNFPRYFDYHSEVDMIIDEEQMEMASEDAQNWLDAKYSGDWITVKSFKNDNTIMVNLCVRSYRMLCLHFQTAEHFKMNKLTNMKMLDNRVKDKNGVYHVDLSDDLIIRAYEYITKPHKTWHKEFVQKNVGKLNFDRINKYYSANSKIEEHILSFLNNSK